MSVTEIISDAIDDGDIMVAPQSNADDTADMITSLVINLARRIGTPSEGEIVSLGRAVGQKLAGMAADADAAFAGRALVICDNETDDDLLDVRCGDRVFSYQVDWDDADLMPMGDDAA